MSQMTVSEMSIQDTTPSHQQRQHWLSEQAFVAAVLADPAPHLGLICELTGPQSQDMDWVAREFSDALNREVTYSDISPEEWEQRLKRQPMPKHLTGHLLAMGELHRAGRYDRQTDGVQRLKGRPAMGRPEICVASRGGVRRPSLLKGTPRQEQSCEPSRRSLPNGENRPQAKPANAGRIYGLSCFFSTASRRCDPAPGSPRLPLKRATLVPASTCLPLREIPALGIRVAYSLLICWTGAKAAWFPF
jgi:hypothetical protein